MKNHIGRNNYINKKILLMFVNEPEAAKMLKTTIELTVINL